MGARGTPRRPAPARAPCVRPGRAPSGLTGRAAWPSGGRVGDAGPEHVTSTPGRSCCPVRGPRAPEKAGVTVASTGSCLWCRHTPRGDLWGRAALHSLSVPGPSVGIPSSGASVKPPSPGSRSGVTFVRGPRPGVSWGPSPSPPPRADEPWGPPGLRAATPFVLPASPGLGAPGAGTPEAPARSPWARGPAGAVADRRLRALLPLVS